MMESEKLKEKFKEICLELGGRFEEIFSNHLACYFDEPVSIDALEYDLRDRKIGLYIKERYLALDFPSEGDISVWAIANRVHFDYSGELNKDKLYGIKVKMIRLMITREGRPRILFYS